MSEWTIASPDLSNLPDDPKKYDWEWWGSDNDWHRQNYEPSKRELREVDFIYRFRIKPEQKTPDEHATEFADISYRTAKESVPWGYLYDAFLAGWNARGEVE